MISHLSAGGLAFVSTSLRAAPGNDGVNADENRQQQIAGQAPTQQRVEGRENVRVVEESAELQKPKGGGEEQLTEEEQRIVQQLKQTDAKVRAHEQAHAAAGGNYASAPTYDYTVGPDGKRYATSGEVQIDASPVAGNPEATIRKMDIVIRAALAPADPSSQDLQVAKQAQSARAKAQAELQKQRLEELQGGGEDDGESGALRLVAREAYNEAEGLTAQIQHAQESEQNLLLVA